MDDAPPLARVYRGDMAERVEQWMVGTIAGNDVVRREATLHQLNEMRRELGVQVRPH